MLIFPRCHDAHISFPRNEMRSVGWHSLALAAKGCSLSYCRRIDPSFHLKLHRLSGDGYLRHSVARERCPGCLLCVCLTYAPTAIYYPGTPKFSVNYPETSLARKCWRARQLRPRTYLESLGRLQEEKIAHCSRFDLFLLHWTDCYFRRQIRIVASRANWRFQ